MIEYIDPRGASATQAEPYALRHKFEGDGANTTVGLLANGFPDSEPFLEAVGAALQSKLPKLTLKSWNKGNASVTVSDEMLDEIEVNCQIAIAAYGH